MQNEENSSPNFFQNIVAALYLITGVIILFLVAPTSSPYNSLLFDLNAVKTHVILFPSFGSIAIPRDRMDIILLMGIIFVFTSIPGAFSRSISLFKDKTYGGSALFLPIFLICSIALASKYESILAFYQMLSGVFALLCLVAGLMRIQLSEGLGCWIKINYSRIKRVIEKKRSLIAVLVILGSFFYTNSISFFAYEHLPYNGDSVAELLHSRFLSEGFLYASAPPFPELFEHNIMLIQDGKWLSPYPPGHLIPLAFFVLLGVPWLLSPLCGALSLYFLYASTRLMYDHNTALLTVVLGASSSFLLLFSSEFLNHVTAFFYFSLFLYGYIVSKTSGDRWAMGALAGLALGLCAATKPLTALGLAIPFVIDAVVWLIKKPSSAWRGLLALNLMALGGVGVFAAFNYLITGDPFMTGYEMYGGVGHHPGFGEIAPGKYHTPIQGIGNSIERYVMLQRHLLGWPVPSLVGVFFLFGSKQYRSWDRLLFSSGVSLLVAYGFFWYYENYFGPRYLYESSGLWLVLTARGLVTLWNALPSGETVYQNTLCQKFVMGIVVSSFLVFSLTFQVQGGIQRRMLFWLPDTEAVRAVQEADITRGVIFITGEYNTAMLLNAATPGSFVTLKDSPSSRTKVVRHFQGLGFRDFYIQKGLTLAPL